MTGADQNDLSATERATLAAALDALLPPAGSFPAPSGTDMSDGFILPQISSSDARTSYPSLDLDGLRAILDELHDLAEIAEGLGQLERESPASFQALWALAVYGYYSRPEVTAAIQRDLAPGYHGAPLPLGYAHVIAPWDASDGLQMPRNPAGRYIRTEDVRRADLSALDGSGA